MLEMGYNQRIAVERLFKASQKFQVLEIVKDYNDIDRVIVAQFQ